MSIFKPQIGKIFFGQTTGGQSVIYPFFFFFLILSFLLYSHLFTLKCSFQSRIYIIQLF